MDTLSETIQELKARGFNEDFIARGDHVQIPASKKKYNAEDLLIVESFRFEGMTDPGDEMTCFAIEARDGAKGTLVMSFSAEHSDGVEIIRKIPSKR